MATLKDKPAGTPMRDVTASAEQGALAELLTEVKAMREELSRLARRESELRAVLEQDTRLDPHFERIRKLLIKGSIERAVSASIDRADLHAEPFPYTIIDDLLPTDFYTALLRGLPPVELFENKPPGKTQLDVPFSLASRYSQRVWSYMANTLVSDVIAPQLVARFRAPIDAWIAQNWPGLAPESVELHGSGGRIMFRRRGYRILPHRDPKWSFMTCILYLARPGDSDSWGTQIYAVDGDEEAKTAAPYWIDHKQCRLVEDVAFRPNRLLAFLNTVGAHGAHIPADAQPESLERFIYQFRIGPGLEAIARLRSLLPAERQAHWAGKALVDY